MNKQRLMIDDHRINPYRYGSLMSRAWERRYQTAWTMTELRIQMIWRDEIASYRITRNFVAMRYSWMTPAERIEDQADFISAELRSATMGRHS